uniref:Uncharacterized protein n=1 Tax=Arundo donax TaxID=35708 RepID=A0A0A8Z5M1_ARUDO
MTHFSIGQIANQLNDQLNPCLS